MSLKRLENHNPDRYLNIRQKERIVWVMRFAALKSMWQKNHLPFFRHHPHQTPHTRKLIDFYNKYNASAISLEEVPIDKVERYGIIKGVNLKRTSAKSINWLKTSNG